MSRWEPENVRVRPSASKCIKPSTYYTQWIEERWSNYGSQCKLFVRPGFVIPGRLQIPSIRSLALNGQSEKSEIRGCAQSQPVVSPPGTNTTLCGNGIRIPPENKCLECIDDSKLPNNSSLNGTQAGSMLLQKYERCRDSSCQITLGANESIYIKQDIQFVKVVPILGGDGSGWTVVEESKANASAAVEATISYIQKIDVIKTYKFYVRIGNDWYRTNRPPYIETTNLSNTSTNNFTGQDGCLIVAGGKASKIIARFDNSAQPQSITVPGYNLSALSNNILRRYIFPNGLTNSIVNTGGKTIFMTSYWTGYTVDLEFKITGFFTNLNNSLIGNVPSTVEYDKIGPGLTKVNIFSYVY